MIATQSAAGSPAVEMVGVSKSFDGKPAVKNVTLVIPRGSTYGLIGPNGAGKTTTIRMMLRILDPDSGDIRVLGQPLTQDSLNSFGYLPEERGIYRTMRVKRLLTFFAELKGLKPRESAPRIMQWLERFDLADRANSKVQELSKGNQQKVQFISTILHDPEIMVFDEPFSGLDPINQQILKDIIVDLRRAGRTILFSTHNIEHAERICDHVCILAKAESVANGSMREVKRAHGGDYIAITLEQWSAAAVDALRRGPGVADVRENGATAEVRMRPGHDSHELLRYLVDQQVKLRRFEHTEPSLEQIFLEKVGAPADIIGEIEAAHV